MIKDSKKVLRRLGCIYGLGATARPIRGPQDHVITLLRQFSAVFFVAILAHSQPDRFTSFTEIVA